MFYLEGRMKVLALSSWFSALEGYVSCIVFSWHGLDASVTHCSCALSKKVLTQCCTVCKIVFHQRGSRETYFKKIVTGKVITQRYRLITKLLLIIKVAYQCHFQLVPVVCNTQSLASSLCHTPGKAFLFGSDKKSTKSRV